MTEAPKPAPEQFRVPPPAPVEPAPDEHLESEFDDRVEGGFDLNPIEQGMYDDDLSVYDGTYSEE
jgi:hypothetical protein